MEVLLLDIFPDHWSRWMVRSPYELYWKIRQIYLHAFMNVLLCDLAILTMF